MQKSNTAHGVKIIGRENSIASQFETLLSFFHGEVEQNLTKLYKANKTLKATISEKLTFGKESTIFYYRFYY